SPTPCWALLFSSSRVCVSFLLWMRGWVSACMHAQIDGFLTTTATMICRSFLLLYINPHTLVSSEERKP
ncbi:hypothetical protein CSUI_011340, partial [Cystoisospora suis]